MGKVKQVLHIIFVLVLALPALFFQTKHIEASTTQNLPFNTTVTGYITNSNLEQTYKITLPRAGKIKVNVDSYIGDIYLDLLDSKGNKVWDEKDIYYGTTTTPKEWSDDEGLEPGTYYIKVYQYGDNTGKYTLNVGYNQANNNDVEPNNGTLQAQPITVNTQNITGYISWNDDTDYYKVTLSKAGRISINLDSYIDEVYLDLLDSKGNKVWDQKDIYYGSPSTPKQWSDYVDLEPGTYFIKIYQYDDYTGTYNLNVHYDTANNNEVEPNNGTTQAQTLTLNKQKISGFISWNDDTDVYKITLPKAGRITVNLDSYLDEVYLDLFNSNGQKIWDRLDIYYGSPSTPKQWSSYEDLEAGTYYIKVSQYSYNTGKYNLSVHYTQANNNEAEPNNGTTQAQTLAMNKQKVTGYISWNDDTDFYKVTLPKAGKITVNLDSYLEEVYLDLLDSKGKQIWYEDIYYGSSSTPKQWSNEETLSPGTYYIKVHKYSEHTGKYVLSVKAPFLLPATPAVNIVSTSSTSVTGKTNTQSTVYVKIGSKTYSKLSDSKGNFKVTIPKQKTGTKIYIYAKNNYGTSGQRTVIVGAPPSTPTITTVSNNSTYVSGKTSKNSTVSVKIGSKTYSKSSDSKGNFKVTIPKQKAGTKIYVIAKNTYGASLQKSVTVIDRIPPSTPSVNSISYKSKYISGRAEANSTVSAYVGSKKIGSTKADKYGKYQMKISPRKKGTSIKVIAIDKAGNKSGGKTVKVR